MKVVLLAGELGTRLREEKPQVQRDWINGGFFVFEPAVLPLITGDEERCS